MIHSAAAGGRVSGALMRRQSSPANSASNWASFKAIIPSLIAGQMKAASFSRYRSRHRETPAQISIKAEISGQDVKWKVGASRRLRLKISRQQIAAYVSARLSEE